MSSFILEKTTIKAIHPISGADRLEHIEIYGWRVVAPKGRHVVGEEVVYVPIDSVLSEELEAKIFPEGSKIKLTNRRVRSIKIRGAISQGFIIAPDEFDMEYLKANISKYEPPESSKPPQTRGNQVKKKLANDTFKKYTDIENYKYYVDEFKEGEEVYISEKLHGSSARYARLMPTKIKWWQKLLIPFGYKIKPEFVYGSRNCQLQDRKEPWSYKNEKQGVEFGDVYTFIKNKYQLDKLIPEGYGFYGEIVGKGIQKGYDYGVPEGDYEFYLYDIFNYNENRWLNVEEMYEIINDINIKVIKVRKYVSLIHGNLDVLPNVKIEIVPMLYVGPFGPELIEQLKTGDSMIADQKVREGCVIKPLIESTCKAGRKVLKCINDEYLLNKNNTDFH